MLLNTIFVSGKKIKGSGKFLIFLPDPLIFLPKTNIRFKSIIVLETTTHLYLKGFGETRMNMKVFTLTLCVNQKNLPAMVSDFLIALNELFIIYFELKMFIMIHYWIIWNNIDSNINLHQQNGCDLNSKLHTLNSNLIKICKYASVFVSVLIIFTLFDVLLSLLFNDSNILSHNNRHMVQTIELRLIYSTVIITLRSNVSGELSHYETIRTIVICIWWTGCQLLYCQKL